MSALSLASPFPTFTDIDGNPLEDGYIYVGTAGLNPETNPIQVYWDAALTVPAAQPIRTLGGYPSRSGAAARMYVNADDCSLLVKNKNGSLIFSALNQTTALGNISSGLITFSHANTYPAGTVGAKLKHVVNVKDAPYNAVGDGVTDDTAAIQAAIAAIVAAGGGSLYFPAGNYAVAKNALTHTTTGISIIFYGDGPTASFISCNDATAGFILKVNTVASNTSAFAMRDMGVNGAQAGIGLHLQGNQAQVHIENIVIQNVATCMQLEGVFASTFTQVRLRNYNVGVQGDTTLVGLPAQNNTFQNCYFSDGLTSAAKAINSANMGYNTYINCDFESSGLIGTVDMRGGNGFDTMIGCRFERLNAAVNSWVYPGNNQKFINCTWHVTGVYNTVGSAYYLLDFGADGTNGVGCVVENFQLSNSTYSSNAVRFASGAKQNKIKFFAPLSTDTLGAVYNVVTDISSGDNLVEYPGGSFELNSTSGISDTWGGGPVNQWITSTFDLNAFTLDGLTNSVVAGAVSTAARGPHGYGYSRDLNTPIGNKKTYFAYNSTVDYWYIASIWVLPKTNGDTISLALDNSLANPTWRTITLSDNTKWQRVWIMFKATSSSVLYFQLRANGATGVYVYGPQFEEWNKSACRFGPSGFVPAPAATGGQNYVYQANPERLNKRALPGIAIPTAGRFNQGDRVLNLGVVAGQPKSWVCTVSGVIGGTAAFSSEGNL